MSDAGFSATPRNGAARPVTPPLINKLLQKICALDIDNLTPVAALTKLATLKKAAAEITENTTPPAYRKKSDETTPSLFD
jgi:hypothetical protein